MNRGAGYALEFVYRNLLAVEIILHGDIIVFDDFLDHLGAVFLRIRHKLLRNLFLHYLISHLALEIVGFHVQKIDDALMLAFEADRYLESDGVLVQALEYGLV